MKLRGSNRLKRWQRFKLATAVNVPGPAGMQQVPAPKGEWWVNPFYQVRVIELEGGATVLSIKPQGGTARHDWREFQLIKNELAGPEREAIELYPAESRLVDTSNQFWLYVFPVGKQFGWGFDQRVVSEAAAACSVGAWRSGSPSGSVSSSRRWFNGSAPTSAGVSSRVACGHAATAWSRRTSCMSCKGGRGSRHHHRRQARRGNCSGFSACVLSGIRMIDLPGRKAQGVRTMSEQEGKPKRTIMEPVTPGSRSPEEFRAAAAAVSDLERALTAYLAVPRRSTVAYEAWRPIAEAGFRAGWQANQVTHTLSEPAAIQWLDMLRAEAGVPEPPPGQHPVTLVTVEQTRQAIIALRAAAGAPAAGEAKERAPFIIGRLLHVLTEEGIIAAPEDAPAVQPVPVDAGGDSASMQRRNLEARHAIQVIAAQLGLPRLGITRSGELSAEAVAAVVVDRVASLCRPQSSEGHYALGMGLAEGVRTAIEQVGAPPPRESRATPEVYDGERPHHDDLVYLAHARWLMGYVRTLPDETRTPRFFRELGWALKEAHRLGLPSLPDGEALAGRSLSARLLRILMQYAGERGTSEGAVEVLERLVKERDVAGEKAGALAVLAGRLGETDADHVPTLSANEVVAVATDYLILLCDLYAANQREDGALLVQAMRRGAAMLEKLDLPGGLAPDEQPAQPAPEQPDPQVVDGVLLFKDGGAAHEITRAQAAELGLCVSPCTFPTIGTVAHPWVPRMLEAIAVHAGSPIYLTRRAVQAPEMNARYFAETNNGRWWELTPPAPAPGADRRPTPEVAS